MRLLFLIICNFCALTDSIIYVNLFKVKELKEKIIFSIITYFFRILVYEFLIGYVVQKLNYKTITLVYVIEFIVTALILGWVRRKTIKEDINNLILKVKEKVISIKPSFNSFLSIFWFAVFCIVVFVAMFVYEYSFDGNYYHLPHIIDYIQQGKIFNTNNTLWDVVYPQDIELLNMFYMMFSSSMRLVRIPQLIFSILGMVSVFSILRELKFDKNIAQKCALLYFTVPVILAQITTTYIDGIVCTLFITLLYLLIKILKNGKFAYELMFFSAMAIFIGTKGTCTIYAMIIVVPYVIYKLYNLIKKKEKFKNLVLKEVLFLLIVALIGGNWMIKNCYNFGNPIHPFKFLNVQGIDADIDIGVENEPYCIKGKSQLKKILTSWIGLDSSYLTYNTGKKIENLFQYHDSRIGGLGVQWFYFLVPCIIIALMLCILKKYKLSRYHLLVCAILIASFCITPANWWGRYVGFIVLLGYIGLCIVYEVFKKYKIFKILLDAVVGFIFVISVVFSCKYPINTLLYNNYYMEYPQALTEYIENSNKNIILLEHSYYNVKSLVYLKGSNLNNHVEAYFIEEMYPNANVKNHKVGSFENVKNLIDSYEGLDCIIIMDAKDKRKNYSYMEKIYNDSTETYKRLEFGEDIIVYERVNN